MKLTNRQFVVALESEDIEVGETLIRRAPTAMKRLVEITGLPEPARRVGVTIFRRRKQFYNKVFGRAWASSGMASVSGVGAANGKSEAPPADVIAATPSFRFLGYIGPPRGVLMLSPDRWEVKDRDQFLPVFYHELTHYLVNSHIKVGRLPDWFAEGLADYAAGRLKPEWSEAREQVCRSFVRTELKGDSFVSFLRSPVPQQQACYVRDILHEQGFSSCFGSLLLKELAIDEGNARFIKKTLQAMRDEPKLPFNEALGKSMDIGYSGVESFALSLFSRLKNDDEPTSPSRT